MRYERDSATRLKLLQQAERILMDELPAIPLYEYVSQNLVRPEVRGFYDNPKDFHPLKYIWVDRQRARQSTLAGRWFRLGW